MALLIALLEPPAIKAAEVAGDYTMRLALQEEAKTLLFGRPGIFRRSRRRRVAGGNEELRENGFEQTQPNQIIKTEIWVIHSLAYFSTGSAAWLPEVFMCRIAA
jgi:hypothetical protein